MDIDCIVKISQIGFYLAAGTIAILTYIKAKNGLLNTVNTEYHKKVIERLQTISEELFREFDSASPSYWARENPARELVERINEQIRDHKEEIINGTFDVKAVGVPVVKSNMHLWNLANRYRTDPFLPKRIRDSVVSFLDGRLSVQREAHIESAEYYLERLRQGKGWDTLDENFAWISNRINKFVYEQGFGISQVEEKINAIRLQIQEYFEGFNPL